MKMKEKKEEEYTIFKNPVLCKVQALAVIPLFTVVALYHKPPVVRAVAHAVCLAFFVLGPRLCLCCTVLGTVGSGWGRRRGYRRSFSIRGRCIGRRRGRSGFE